VGKYKFSVYAKAEQKEAIEAPRQRIGIAQYYCNEIKSWRKIARLLILAGTVIWMRCAKERRNKDRHKERPSIHLTRAAAAAAAAVATFQTRAIGGLCRARGRRRGCGDASNRRISSRLARRLRFEEKTMYASTEGDGKKCRLLLHSTSERANWRYLRNGLEARLQQNPQISPLERKFSIA
jgi:hypothetical protein